MKSIADSIVRQVGAGFDRPDGDRALPLDINYAKLSEWLVSSVGQMRVVAMPQFAEISTDCKKIL